MRILNLGLLIFLTGCQLATVPVGTPIKDDGSFEVVASGPANASPGDIIIYDATGSNADSIAWSAFIVSDNASKIDLVLIENNTKVIVPPKVGEIYITVAGCKGKVVKMKTYRTIVTDKYSPGPVNPETTKSDFTKFVISELAKVNSPNKNAEKNVLKNNIQAALDSGFSDPVDFTDKLRELNRSTMSETTKTAWSGFNAAIGQKLDSMKLSSMDQHTKVYQDFVKGLK